MKQLLMLLVRCQLESLDRSVLTFISALASKAQAFACFKTQLLRLLSEALRDAVYYRPVSLFSALTRKMLSYCVFRHCDVSSQSPLSQRLAPQDKV